MELYTKQRSNKINHVSNTSQICIKTKKLKVVFYLRVSTKHKEQLSALKEQEKWMQKLEQKHPEWEVLNYYIDFGKTGTNFKRPNFEKMMSELDILGTELIVAREISRFGRNVRETLNIATELKYKNIAIYFVLDKLNTTNSNDLTDLAKKAADAESEARRTSIKVRETFEFKIDYDENSKAYGPPRCHCCLGYKHSKEKEHWEVVEEEAEAVRFIFNSYAQGVKTADICLQLVKNGYKKKRGDLNWTKPDIYRILRYPTYIGYQFQGKEIILSDDFLDKKKTRIPKENWVLVNIKEYVPTIIDEELFFKVQKMINTPEADESIVKQRKIADTSADVWRLLLLCNCGYTYAREHNRGKIDEITYSCYKRRRSIGLATIKKEGLNIEGTCKIKAVPYWKLLFMYHKIVSNLFKDKNRIINNSLQLLKSNLKLDSNLKEVETEVALIEKKIEQLSKKRLNFQNMLAEYLLTQEEYTLHLDKLKIDKEGLQQRINDIKIQYKEPIAFDALAEELKLVFDSLIVDNYTNDELARTLFDLVVHVEDNKFMWFLNLRTTNEEVADRNKLIFNKHTAGGIATIIKDKSKKLMSFKLNVDEARDFKYKIGAGYVKRWEDIEVEVYL